MLLVICLLFYGWFHYLPYPKLGEKKILDLNFEGNTSKEINGFSFI